MVYSLTSVNNNPQLNGAGVSNLTTTGATGVFTVNASSLTPGATYSFAAYATNSIGTSYTSVSTFTTGAIVPTVTTPTSANVASTSATLGGDVTSDGGASIIKRGVLYAPTASDSTPTLGDGIAAEATDSASTTGVFTENVSSLTPGTGYSFVAFATNSAGTTYTSPVSTFTTLAAPTVTTPTDTSITATTATLGGDVTSDGGASITTCGVVYALTSTNANPQLNGTGVINLTTTGTTGVFTVNASSLTPGATYSFAAYATNSVGTSYSSVSTFTMQAVAPTVTTPTAASITSTSATLGGDATSDGGATITTCGVVYALTSTNANPQLNGTGVSNLTTTGATGVFTVNASSLTPGATYSFAAYATNSVGTSYSSVSTFTMQAVAPTVTTPTAASITSTSATLGGDATSDGGATITTCGVVYALTSANANPQLNGTGVTNLTTTGATGVFTVNADSLTPGAKYSFAAYATNSVGTSYTSVSTFTAGAVAPTVTTPTSASITSTSATLGGDVASDGGASIIKRGILYAPTASDSTPTLGDGIAAEMDDSASTTGVFTENVSSLTPDTLYSFVAFAANGAGTSYTSVSTFTTQVQTAPSGAIPTDVPLFTWQPLTGGVSEELAVVDRTTGGNLVLLVPNLSGNTYQLPAAQALLIGHAYTWYIGEVGSTGAIAWSGGTTFNVTPLAAPTPIAPTGTILTSTGYDTPTFTWSSVPNAVQYDLYVQDTLTGITTVYTPNVSGSSFTPGQPLLAGHSYVWYVGAKARAPTPVPFPGAARRPSWSPGCPRRCRPRRSRKAPAGSSRRPTATTPRRLAGAACRLSPTTTSTWRMRLRERWSSTTPP